MNRCLICFKKVEETLNNTKVCNECLSRFEVINKKIIVDDTEVFILYKYNDFIKELLYRFKGCYDYVLKDAFLNDYLLILKKKYKNRKVICAPSSREDDLKRGFNHVKEIFKCLDLEILDCLSKNKNYKQSDQSYNKRDKIKKVIKFDKNAINSKDKILIVDDVTTSLSTIKTIIHLLPTNIDKKVFVIASNCRFMGNDFS